MVSRAGALSVSELCVAGKAAILVPSPNVSEDHQTKNAMALVDEGAALIVRDGEAVNKLVSEAIALLNDEGLQSDLKENILKLAKPKAAKEIAEVVNTLV